MALRSLAPCALLAASLAGAHSAQGPGNVVLVIADDVGVYELASYAEGTDPAVTPTIDALAASGVVFRNCWANPLCSPTRATIQTGRYSLQTGVGPLLTASWGLQLGEITLAEALKFTPDPYASGYFGKWHLSNESTGGYLAPNLQGYNHAIWTLHNLIPPAQDYTTWLQVENGVEVAQTGYITSHVVDRALEFVAVVPEPWFVVLSFHAAHDPFHVPPAGLYTSDVSAATPENQRPLYKAMIEALDFELGRFLASLQELEKTADVIFVGDNGSPQGVIGPPGTADKSKGTIFEGGVNVPLIIAGPSVTAPGSQCDALVNTTDLFATVLELGGLVIPAWIVDALTLNSTSVVPYLGQPKLPSLRGTVYAEWFSPGGFAATQYKGTVREARYKLQLLFPPMTLRMYDLETDPLEIVNLLLAPLAPEAKAGFDALLAELIARIVTYGP